MKTNTEDAAVTCGTQETTRPIFLPRYHVSDEERVLKVYIDVPGATQDGIELEIEGRKMQLRARVESLEIPEGMRALNTEFEVGDYERDFTLPEGIDPDGVEASLHDGVLELTLVRAEKAHKRIEIK